MRARVMIGSLLVTIPGLVMPTGPARALDMESALSEAVAAHPSLVARAAIVEAMRRRIGPAGAWPAPRLELGVSNLPASGRFDADAMTMKVVGLSQAVPVSGRAGLRRRAATSAWQAERAAAEVAGFELLGAAWQAYADAYFARELVRSEGLHRAIMDRMVQTARAGYATGRGSHHDMARAEAERARLQPLAAALDDGARQASPFRDNPRSLSSDILLQ
jgi:outer membrane protein TolC